MIWYDATLWLSHVLVHPLEKMGKNAQDPSFGLQLWWLRSSNACNSLWLLRWFEARRWRAPRWCWWRPAWWHIVDFWCGGVSYVSWNLSGFHRISGYFMESVEVCVLTYWFCGFAGILPSWWCYQAGWIAMLSARCCFAGDQSLQLQRLGTLIPGSAARQPSQPCHIVRPIHTSCWHLFAPIPASESSAPRISSYSMNNSIFGWIVINSGWSIVVRSPLNGDVCKRNT